MQNKTLKLAPKKKTMTTRKARRNLELSDHFLPIITKTQTRFSIKYNSKQSPEIL